MREPRAETLPASAPCSSGRGNHAAADRFRGRAGVQRLRAGPQGRFPARSGDRAQHPPGARRRDAAHDRRAAGAGAHQHAAQRRLREFSPHRFGFSRSIWQGRRRAGGGPRRPPVVLLGRGGQREPSAAQQPGHRRQGVCEQNAAILEPVRRRGETTADRDGRGAGASRRRGPLRHFLQPADRDFPVPDRKAAPEPGLDDLDLRRRRHQLRAHAKSASDDRQARIALALCRDAPQAGGDPADGLARRRAADHEFRALLGHRLDRGRRHRRKLAGRSAVAQPRDHQRDRRHCCC